MVIVKGWISDFCKELTFAKVGTAFSGRVLSGNKNLKSTPMLWETEVNKKGVERV